MRTQLRPMRCTPYDFLVHVDHVFFEDNFFYFDQFCEGVLASHLRLLPAVNQTENRHKGKNSKHDYVRKETA